MRHTTITQWAWQMILHVSRRLPGRRLVIVADGTYAVLDCLGKGSRLVNVSVLTRLRLDACLSDPVVSTTKRKALTGPRQPKRSARLPDPHTLWQKHTLPWYGGTTREVEIATGTALCFPSPIPPVAIRWVLVRDPQGQYEPLALWCTDQQAEAHQIVACCVLRWTVDVPFHEVRAHLGVETRAPMVRSGHPAHHSRLLGTLFPRDHCCSAVVGGPTLPASSGCLGLQSLAHLCRDPG